VHDGERGGGGGIIRVEGSKEDGGDDGRSIGGRAEQAMTLSDGAVQLVTLTRRLPYSLFRLYPRRIKRQLQLPCHLCKTSINDGVFSVRSRTYLRGILNYCPTCLEENAAKIVVEKCDSNELHCIDTHTHNPVV
jgi:hypothetical protein